jgi:amino-acid racemase
MRCIGIIGGMSWESTAEYYRLLNQAVVERLGGLHSARLLLHSVDFADVAELQQRGAWDEAGALLARAAAGLEGAGADAVILATNTMHEVAAAIEAAITVPFLHIVDPTGAALRDAGVKVAGLLGTRYTMERPFWRERLAARFGLDLIVPDADDRTTVHDIIFQELCRGRVESSSRRQYQGVIERLRRQGADAVILGCTEITLLLTPGDSSLPVFDTTRLHVDAAARFALGDALRPRAVVSPRP